MPCLCGTTHRWPPLRSRCAQFGNVRIDAEFVWVLDPIDGTKSFITGKPLFGTLIGLCHNGVPTLGVIDQCVLKERWVGVRGKGTTLNGAPVRARGVSSLADAMLYATTPHMFAKGAEEEAFATVRDAVKRPLYGCDCYAYALVASGALARTRTGGVRSLERVKLRRMRPCARSHRASPSWRPRLGRFWC